MSLKAITYHVMLKPDETKEQYKGLLDLSALDAKAEKNAQTIGTIVDIGEDAFVAYKPKTPFAGLKIGDRVHFPRYSGKWVKDLNTNEEFLIINDEDIIAKEQRDVDSKLAS